VTSTYAVLRISLSHGQRVIREVSTGNEEGHILAVCTVPAGSGGSETCAILRDEGRISICGLDTPDGYASLLVLVPVQWIDALVSPGRLLAPRNLSTSRLSTTIRSLVERPGEKCLYKTSIILQARQCHWYPSTSSLEHMYSLHLRPYHQTRLACVAPLVLRSSVNLGTPPISNCYLHPHKAAATSRASRLRYRARQYEWYPPPLNPNKHLCPDLSRLARLHSPSRDNLDHLPAWLISLQSRMKRRKKKSRELHRNLITQASRV
jgi:hypothetical protein